jgi:hypothetical protein
VFQDPGTGDGNPPKRAGPFCRLNTAHQRWTPKRSLVLRSVLNDRGVAVMPVCYSVDRVDKRLLLL